MKPEIKKRIDRAKGEFDRRGGCFICGSLFIDCPHSTGEIEIAVRRWHEEKVLGDD